MKAQNYQQSSKKKIRKKLEFQKKHNIVDETSPIDLTEDIIHEPPAHVYQPKITYLNTQKKFKKEREHAKLKEFIEHVTLGLHFIEACYMISFLRIYMKGIMTSSTSMEEGVMMFLMRVVKLSKIACQKN